MGVAAGHANVQTDIKEATFLGGQDDLVAAGSDDGSVYVYEAATGHVIKILQADEDVANCVQVLLLFVSQWHFLCAERVQSQRHTA